MFSLYLRSEMLAKKVGSEMASLLGSTGASLEDPMDLDLDSRGLSRGRQKYRKTLHFLDLAEQIRVKPLRSCTFLLIVMFSSWRDITKPSVGGTRQVMKKFPG